MVAQLKYGSGIPFYRLERLEDQLGIPLAATTQWEIVEEAAEVIKPARCVAGGTGGEVLHNDDTGMKVLKLERATGDKRTGETRPYWFRESRRIWRKIAAVLDVTRSVIGACRWESTSQDWPVRPSKHGS